jgi:hypothetical protein
MAMDATEARMEVVRQLNSSYKDQVIQMTSEIKGLKECKSAKHS